MPSISLTAEQRQVLVSWLWSPRGYLNLMSLSSGQTAREVLIADPLLDLVSWKRSNGGSGWMWNHEGQGFIATPADAEEVASIWWVVYRWDGNNIPPPQMPSEYPQWLGRFGQWKQSILDAYVRVPQEQRNTLIDIYDESGSLIDQWTQGYHLGVQVSFIDRAGGA